MLAYFHMATHALFKSLLFMGGGYMIGQNFGIQDSRFFGGYCLVRPTVGSYFCLRSLRLMGFPFLAGFYSKDMILESMMRRGESLFIQFVLIFSCVLTVVYSLRVFRCGYAEYPVIGSILTFREGFFMSLSIMVLGT